VIKTPNTTDRRSVALYESFTRLEVERWEQELTPDVVKDSPSRSLL